MKVSKKAYYGLRAAISLAEAKHPVSAHDLARTEHIPEDFLEKILQGLRRAGIADSKKGAEGGYFLARRAEQVNAWDVLKALDAPFPHIVPPMPKGELPARNASRSDAGGPCPPLTHCKTNEVWRTLEREIEKTLSKITLNNLVKPQD